jgi:hypothetical protein
MKSGHAEHDTAAGCAVLEGMAGVKRKKGQARRKLAIVSATGR